MTTFQLASRYIGIRELTKGEHPLVQWWLSLCGYDLDTPDETPWCSAFVNGIHWELRLPRTKSARARSWLQIGTPVVWGQERLGDVVVLRRGDSTAGPDVIDAPGHVGFFAGREDGVVLVLGGNQGNQVSVARFHSNQVLGIRRVQEVA